MVICRVYIGGTEGVQWGYIWLWVKGYGPNPWITNWTGTLTLHWKLLCRI